MRKIFSLLFLLSLFVYSPAYAAERPKEFQGLFWGIPASKVEGLVPQKGLPQKSGKEDEKIYTQTTDTLKISGGDVKKIEYLFVKDCLAQVTIPFEGYQQYLNFVNVFVRLYGVPDKDEIDEMIVKHSWYAEKEDEADLTLFYGSLIESGFVSMKCKKFLKNGTGLVLGSEAKMEKGVAGWQLFREDDEGKWFYDNDGRLQSDKDTPKIRVKCILSIKRQNELRISLRSKIMPRFLVLLEEIQCAAKETRNLQTDILSERGPLGSFQKIRGWEPVASGSRAESLYNQVCK